MHELINEKINEKVYWMTQYEHDKVDCSYDSSKFELKWWIIVWKLISSKHFRWQLKHTLLYALRWQNDIRGTGSVDVMLFESHYAEDIFKIKEEII